MAANDPNGHAINNCFTVLAGARPHILAVKRPAKDWFVCTRSPGRSLLYNFGLDVLTSSVVLLASTLCLQAAILGQDNDGRADDRSSVT